MASEPTKPGHEMVASALIPPRPTAPPPPPPPASGARPKQPDQIPEAVYHDAARAATFPPDEGEEPTPDWLIRKRALGLRHRAAVEFAYRAGFAAAQSGPLVAEIWVDQHRQSGQPCVWGTRLPVLTLVGYADACGDAAALEAYPWATADDLAACRAFLAEWKPINDDEPPADEPDWRIEQGPHDVSAATLEAAAERIGDVRPAGGTNG